MGEMWSEQTKLWTPENDLKLCFICGTLHGRATFQVKAMWMDADGLQNVDGPVLDMHGHVDWLSLTNLLREVTDTVRKKMYAGVSMNEYSIVDGPSQNN